MWYFVSPQIVFGEGALDALDDVQGARALLVTDNVLVGLGLVDTVTAHLDKAGIAWRVFDAVEPDPSTETALAGAQIALEYTPDWIIAVGGGSVMDAAKAIWVLYERPDLEPADINPMVDLNLRRKARLITIPTTSGTGSEVTWAIVLTDTAEQRKMSLGNRENTADLAIVDPVMATGMPPRLTADTGLDALTHAIEGYTCTWHTERRHRWQRRGGPRAIAQRGDRRRIGVRQRAGVDGARDRPRARCGVPRPARARGEPAPAVYDRVYGRRSAGAFCRGRALHRLWV